METMVNISAAHLYSDAVISIFASEGSIGKSDMRFPSLVRSPMLSSAPSTQSWYIEFKMFSCRYAARVSVPGVTIYIWQIYVLEEVDP